MSAQILRLYQPYTSRRQQTDIMLLILSTWQDNKMKKQILIRKIKRSLKAYNINISFDNENEIVEINNLKNFDLKKEEKLCKKKQWDVHFFVEKITELKRW